MKKFLQIIYISRSTFEALDANNKIEPNVARILAKSRTNNRANGLVGVLYFGDGIFFQCLEGYEASVNALLLKLKRDSRHKDLKVISRKYIEQLSFGDWAMKFAPLDEQIQKFLKENNIQKFNPYEFSGEMINKFLNLLFNANESTPNLIQKNKPNNIDIYKYNQYKANIALTLSIMAMLISLIAIFKV